MTAYLKTTLKKRETTILYVGNLNELSYIKTLYKSNTNLNICENHYNCDRIYVGKNVILFRNFVKLNIWKN